MIGAAVLAAAAALGSSSGAEIGKHWPQWAQKLLILQCEDNGFVPNPGYCTCLVAMVEGALTPQQALTLNNAIVSSKLGGKLHDKHSKLLRDVKLACLN